MDLRCQSPTVKHKHGLVIVWETFHYDGVVPLIYINAIMDQNIYKNILNHMLFDARKKMARGWMFQEANDSKHSSQLVKKCFTAKNIEVLN